jgi:chromosome segregation ATPase
MTPSPNITKQRPTKKLLLLISTNSIDRQVKVRQDLVQTALTAAKIEYDVIDGSVHDNETNKTIRNELFALSGLRGVYPQFFIVNLEPPCMDDGHKTGTSFWGTFEQFQHVNDDGQLQQAFGDVGHISLDHNKAVSRNLYPSETVPGVEEASNLTENNSKNKATTLTVPDDIYEKFSQQIQRIEENYQVERQETEQRHLQALQQQQQLYQQCELEKRELEEKLSNELRQKDEQLQEMYRRNEGFRLKLDGLKREVTGTQELLHGRDQELQKANQKYLNDLRAMEKRMNNSEKSANKYQEEVQSIQAKLDNTETELQSSKQEYETMKERAKDIAAELKHRRSECRQLQDSVAELTEQNNRLKSKVHSLEERLNHQGLNQSDKDKEIEMLRAQLTEAKEKMKTIENVWQEKLAKSENVLVEYKKRAQHSLSMSNSRTAAAVQAREEAELDARAARSTADAALERSVKAEVEAREAVAKAKLTVKAMEEERDEAMKRSDEMKYQLMAAEKLQVEKEREKESLLSTIQNKDMEIDRLRGCMNEADAKIASTQQKIMEYTNTIDDLREEISALRAELQRATASAVTVVSAKNDDEGSKVMKYAPSPILVNGSHDESEDDSPLAALRMELREANDAIEDLKSALKNAVEMNEELQRTYSGSDNNTASPDNTSRSDVGQTHSTDATPLFYAMEKQAELKTARTEMNRLASLLADVQSEKMEAYDAMEEMRRRLDEAESRLKRHEKLGMASNVLNTTDEATHDNNISSAVNIEYLKHILLRFMNAKTQTERKTLVPVIGAVLELTPDEVQAATQNIERQSASIVTGNGNSLFSFLS